MALNAVKMCDGAEDGKGRADARDVGDDDATAAVNTRI